MTSRTTLYFETSLLLPLQQNLVTFLLSALCQCVLFIFKIKSVFSSSFQLFLGNFGHVGGSTYSTGLKSVDTKTVWTSNCQELKSCLLKYKFVKLNFK